jgi:hypothetical protein
MVSSASTAVTIGEALGSALADARGTCWKIEATPSRSRYGGSPEATGSLAKRR